MNKFYVYHPVKFCSDNEVERCKASDADAFGVYRLDETGQGTRVETWVFDCLTESDAEKAIRELGQ